MTTINDLTSAERAYYSARTAEWLRVYSLVPADRQTEFAQCGPYCRELMIANGAGMPPVVKAAPAWATAEALAPVDPCDLDDDALAAIDHALQSSAVKDATSTDERMAAFEREAAAFIERARIASAATVAEATAVPACDVTPAPVERVHVDEGRGPGSPPSIGADTIEVLRHKSLRLTKLWKADGTIEGYDNAKWFERTSHTVRNLRELSAMLRELESDPHAALIRGRYRGDDAWTTDNDKEAKTKGRRGLVRKAKFYFEDQPLHTAGIDVDDFAPLTASTTDGDEAVREYINTVLPVEFRGAGYHWQLSSSAGHVKPGETPKLKAHIWFWLAEPLTCAQLTAWAKGRQHVDAALYRVVQWHYTAAPVFEPGVTDPIAVRSGFVDGSDVKLDLSPQARAAVAPEYTTVSGPRTGVDMSQTAVQYLYDNDMVRDDSEGPRGKLHVVCPNSGEHTANKDNPSSTSYAPLGFEGSGRPEFRCQHGHCEHIHTRMFLRLIGYDDPLDDFEDESARGLTPEEEVEQARIRDRNAKKPAPVKLESSEERTARLQREKDMAEKAGIDGKLVVPPKARTLTGATAIEQLVFIQDGSRVAFIDTPGLALSLSDFRNAHAASKQAAENAAGRRTVRSVADLWLEHADRRSVFTTTFAPGREVFTVDPDNKLALNTWRPYAVDDVPDNWRELAAPLFEHIEYLVPVASERARFIQWVAHIIQDPGTLPHGHYLFVTPMTGIGRNTLGSMLARAFTGCTVLGFSLGGSLRSGFNGELAGRLLAVVDEVREGMPDRDTARVAEKLKETLTTERRSINPKYGRLSVEFNAVRFLMFSNHDSALPIDEKDRRLFVIANPTVPREASYYLRLVAAMERPGFGAAVREALRHVDLSEFNPGERAPMNAVKQRVVEAGRTEVEKAIRDIAETWPSDCIRSSRLQSEVERAIGSKVGIQHAAVAAGLGKYGQVKIDGDKANVWVLRNHEKWQHPKKAEGGAGASGAAVAEEVTRGEQIEGAEGAAEFEGLA
jgi:hypothetical protein